MVGHKRNFIFVKNRFADFFELINCRRACNIVSQHQIHLRYQQVACRYFGASGVFCQYLLRHCHSHNNCLLYFYSIKLNKKTLPALMQTGAIINRGTTLIGTSLCLTLLCVASYSVQKRGSRASFCCFAAAACTIRRFSLPVLTACSRSSPLIIT